MSSSNRVHRNGDAANGAASAAEDASPRRTNGVAAKNINQRASRVSPSPESCAKPPVLRASYENPSFMRDADEATDVGCGVHSHVIPNAISDASDGGVVWIHRF